MLAKLYGNKPSAWDRLPGWKKASDKGWEEEESVLPSKHIATP